MIQDASVMKVNEIFYSLQGEGRWTGRPAVFIRFSGCNLKCPFCDTDFSKWQEMTEWEIMQQVQQEAPVKKGLMVVLTGGEPTIQNLDKLVRLLHEEGYYIAIETNGTGRIPAGIDWVTISPKDAFVGAKGATVIKTCNELKVVFEGIAPKVDLMMKADYYYLQPCDKGDAQLNEAITQQCVEFIKQNPKWQLSIQTQKILKVR